MRDELAITVDRPKDSPQLVWDQKVSRYSPMTQTIREVRNVMEDVGYVTVDTEPLAGILRGLSMDAAQIRSEVVQLKTLVSGLNNSWENSDRVAFNKEFEQSTSLAEKDIWRLDKLVEMLEVAVKAYQDLEEVLNEEAARLSGIAAGVKSGEALVGVCVPSWLSEE